MAPTKKNNLISVWTRWHDQELPKALAELGDGIKGIKVTGSMVKKHNVLFALLDCSLVGRKIRDYRKRSLNNGTLSCAQRLLRATLFNKCVDCRFRS